MDHEDTLRYRPLKIGILIVPSRRGKTTHAISDSIETNSPVETEIVGVVTHSATEITEITLFKKNRS